MPTLPSDFEVKDSSSRYMKFKPGETKFRILGDAIAGLEYWTSDRKPVRKRKGDKITTTELEGSDGNGLKQFVCWPVWNYGTNQVEILEVTQKSILRTLSQYESDEDWGDLSNYDIVVNRTGTDFNNTEYNVIPKPAKAPEKTMLDAWNTAKENGFNLEALFLSEDPFTYGNKESKVAKSDEVNIDDIPF